MTLIHDLSRAVVEGLMYARIESETRVIGDLRNEMWELFSKLSTSVKQQFQVVKQQNVEYDAVLVKIQCLEDERVQDKKNICILEEKIETLERKIRSTRLKIRNKTWKIRNKIRVSKTLNDAKPPDLKEESKTVNINLHEQHIKDVYRINSKNESLKPLIVEFYSVVIKENLLKAVKDFNKDKIRDDERNTSHFNVPGPARPVYLSETLTFKTMVILPITRIY